MYMFLITRNRSYSVGHRKKNVLAEHNSRAFSRSRCHARSKGKKPLVKYASKSRKSRLYKRCLCIRFGSLRIRKRRFRFFLVCICVFLCVNAITQRPKTIKFGIWPLHQHCRSISTLLTGSLAVCVCKHYLRF